jgi:predicted ATPase/class 3 adenylate cyclase
MDVSPNNSALLDELLPDGLAQLVRGPAPPVAALEQSCAALEARLAALLPFVPGPALDVHLAQPGQRALAGQHLSGTVVVVELLGVRNLAARLARLGRQGNEALTVLLNGLFDLLLAQVYSYGGRVLKFGGDSFTAFFEAARLGPAHTSFAVQAAQALHAVMASYQALPATISPVELQLRAAAHVGTLFFSELGDASHRELIVTGYASNRVAVALESGGAGELIVTGEVLRALSGARAQPKAKHNYRLDQLDPLPPPAPATRADWQPGTPSIATLEALLSRIAALRPYLPYRLPARFLGPAAERGEFRAVTVLFADFYPFKQLLSLLELPAAVAQDTAIVGRLLNICYVRTQSVIQRYGGSINKIDMAPFGNRLMALFGAPAAAGNDVVGAVQAALALREMADAVNRETAALLHEWIDLYPEHRPLRRLARISTTPRIGVATGNVFAGLIGGQQRHDYTVLGQTVQLAARLLAVADSREILLSSLVYRSTQQLVAVEPAGVLRLDEAERPVPTYRAWRVPHADGRSLPLLQRKTPLVGRKAELARLLALAQAALSAGDAAGRVVALVGEPGVGKSRLLEAMVSDLRVVVPEAKIVQGASQSHEQSAPYATIAQLLPPLLGAPSVGDVAERALLIKQRVEALTPSSVRFFPLLHPLLRLPPAETELTQSLSAEQRHNRLHDLLVEICLASAIAQPLALIIDDAQWTDLSSRVLLERLAALLPGQCLLLLLAYRPSPEQPQPWPALAGDGCIELRELDKRERAQLVQALLGGSAPSALQPLIAGLDGTPVVIEEMVRYLIDSGALQRSDTGEWSYEAHPDSDVVPVQIEQLVTARVDRVSRMARATLQTAAVIGARFSDELLIASGEQAASLAQHLDELVAASLIIPDQGALPLGYRFRHELIHDIVYNNMLFARRRELHAQVAGVIERLYHGALDERRVLLAQHYRKAERWEAALTHLLAAARHSQAQYANQEALALFEQAYTVLELHAQERGDANDTTAAALLEAMADVLALIGSYDNARTTFERALHVVANTGGAAVQRAALQRKIGSTYEQQGDATAALNCLRQALAEISKADEQDAAATLEHACVLSDIGWACWRQGDLDAARTYLEQALALIGSERAFEERARVLNRLGGVAWGSGELDRARTYVEQSLLASERSGNLVAQANALSNLGVLLENQGLVEESIDYGLRALQIRERIGSKRDVAISAINIGYAFLGLGQYDEAHRYFTSALEQANAVRDSYHQMRALHNLGSVLTHMQHWDAAEQNLRQSLALAKLLRLPNEQLENYVALGELALQRRDLDAARLHYEAGLPLATQPEREELARFQRLAGRIALAAGQPDIAALRLGQSLALFERLQNVSEAEKTRQLLRSARG